MQYRMHLHFPSILDIEMTLVVQMKGSFVLGVGGGGGVTKASFVNFPISNIFDLAKVLLRLFESHLYLTGTNLSNIKVIFNR